MVEQDAIERAVYPIIDVVLKKKQRLSSAPSIVP